MDLFVKITRSILLKKEVLISIHNRIPFKNFYFRFYNSALTVRQESKDEKINKIRNIGIIAHIDAGKTTTTEKLINKTGLTKRAGSVDCGDTVMDYLPEERERGITIASAAITLPWKGYKINLIDTPGHVDFTVEVERSLRVMDSAVIILDASKGIQAQTLTVWKQAKRYGVKCFIFVNKMDKVGANLQYVLADISKHFGQDPLLLNEPVFINDSFESIRESESGVESVAEKDDLFLEKYLKGVDEGTEIKNSDLNEAIARIVKNETAIPVILGSSVKDIGIEAILDGIVNYLPAPTKPKSNEFKALAFKVTYDIRRKCFLVYCRIFEGSLSSKRLSIYNVNKKRYEQVTRIMQAMADEMIEIEEAEAGQIVILSGLKHSATGDTLTQIKSEECFEGINVPSPVISVSIEAESAGSQDHLDESLQILQLEDPSAQVTRDSDTGQTILRGMGELHLEILQSRLKNDLKAHFRTGPVTIAYRESLKFNETSMKTIEHSIAKELYGIKFEGSVTLEIYESEVFNVITDNTVDEETKSAIFDGIFSALSRGPLSGYPVKRNLTIKILEINVSTINSARMLLKEAVCLLFKEAVKDGNMVKEEPLVRLEIDTEAEYVGHITSDLYSNRNCIECDSSEERKIRALVPLRKMLNYSTWLRSQTAGRASFSMESIGYTEMIQ